MLLQSEASVALMEAGRAAIWDARFGEAEQIFEELAGRPDGATAAAFHRTTIALLRAIFTDSRAAYDVFWTRAEAMQALLDDQPTSPWALYFDGELALYRAVAAGKTERYVRAAWAARRAYAIYETLLEARPDFYDAYASVGLFHVMIGSLPSGYRRLLGILGYEGSVPQGTRELALAAERGRYARTTAQILSALADIMLNNSQGGGLEQLEALRARLPASPLVEYLYGYGLLTNRRAEEALPHLRNAWQAGTQGAYFYIDYVEFYLAQALFQLGRYEEAVRHYEHYLDRHQGLALKSVAHLEAGLSLELLDRRAAALRHYRQVESTRDFDSDAAARRLAQRRLAAAMTDEEQTLLVGRNAYDAGHYAEALRLLRPVLEQGSPAGRAEAAYRLGRVYQALGQAEQALDAYAYAVEHPTSDPQDRWSPWSFFYMGEIYAEMGASGRARTAYSAALDYPTPFDYYQSLEQQARIGLARLDAQ